MAVAAVPAARDGANRNGAAPFPFDPWRHRFAGFLVFLTFVLLGVGGLVTSTGSGLSVPDWPLSYGMWMPPMVGGVFFEHGHRMVAGTVGFLTLILAVWTQVREARRSVRILVWAAALAVLAQGILGGLTVLFLLPTSVSVAHACLAQTFFCLVIACSSVTSPSWFSSTRPKEIPGLRGSAIVVVSVVFLQLLLGGIMRHLDARSWADSVPLPIPDFPLSLGRVVPPLDSIPVTVHFAHRVCAVVLLAASVRLVIKCFRLEARYRRPALSIVGLVIVQIGLGAATVLSRRAVLPTTAHLMTGALILGTSFLLTLRAFHDLSSPRTMDVLPRLDSFPVRS